MKNATISKLWEQPKIVNTHTLKNNRFIQTSFSKSVLLNAHWSILTAVCNYGLHHAPPHFTPSSHWSSCSSQIFPFKISCTWEKNNAVFPLSEFGLHNIMLSVPHICIFIYIYGSITHTHRHTQIYDIFSLSIQPLIGTWTDSKTWLLCTCKHITLTLIFLGENTGMVCCLLWGTPTLISMVTGLTCPQPCVRVSLPCPHTPASLCYVLFLRWQPYWLERNTILKWFWLVKTIDIVFHVFLGHLCFLFENYCPPIDGSLFSCFTLSVLFIWGLSSCGILSCQASCPDFCRLCLFSGKCFLCR